MNGPQPAEMYRQRAQSFGEERARHERRARRNGNLNVLLFFSAALSVA